MSSKFIKSRKILNNILYITFQNDEMDHSLINAFRRITIGENITYSLKGEVKILINTSCFNDEYLINRINMIPLQQTLAQDNQDLVFYLCHPNDPKLPIINNNDIDITITAHQFQIYDTTGNKSNINVTDIIPYDFPLIKLRKGQEFHLFIKPESGIGRRHATWKSCTATIKYENVVSLGEKVVDKTNPITGTIIETIPDKRDYPKNSLGNPKFITLSLKSNGHLTSEDAFKLTLTTLENKLLTLKHLIDNPMASHNDEKSSSIEIIPSTDINNFIQVKITDPDKTLSPIATHTIGNLLAEHMNYRLLKMLNNNMDLIRESMSAYLNPHPLDSVIYLKIKTPDNLYKDSTDIPPSLRLLDDTIEDILGYIRQIKVEFK